MATDGIFLFGKQRPVFFSCFFNLSSTINTSLSLSFLLPLKKMLALIAATTMINDRRAVSRERNKMHARKTRQRKKEHMVGLEKRVNDLKTKQIGMKQLINEKATANILLCLAPRSNNIVSSDVDPKVEALIQRPNSEIPDASKIPDLPVLVLPGASSKKRKADQASDVDTFSNNAQYPDDGIDYQLLGKDRALCSPEELDKIRRERNRMHAKRTRDRKRIFMERMDEIMKTLESENMLLEKHLTEITKDSNISLGRTGVETPSLSSPSLQPCLFTTKSQDFSQAVEVISSQPSSMMGSTVVPGSNTIKAVVFNISSSVVTTDNQKTASLLTSMTGGREDSINASNSTNAFHTTGNTTAISVSDDGVSSQCSSNAIISQKRQRLDVDSDVPTSITTNNPKAVSC